jgi:hypothetical protein
MYSFILSSSLATLHLSNLGVVFFLIISVDVTVPRTRCGVNGALALLESARRHLGGIPLIALPAILFNASTSNGGLCHDEGAGLCGRVLVVCLIHVGLRAVLGICVCWSI